MNSTIHADQEYVYFIVFKMFISMCYKRVHKINMLFYLQVNNITSKQGYIRLKPNLRYYLLERYILVYLGITVLWEEGVSVRIVD